MRPFTRLLALCTFAVIFSYGSLQGTAAQFNAKAANPNNSFALTALYAPTSLQAGASSSSSIRLGWTASASTFATGYNLLRSTTSGGPYTQIAQVAPATTTSYKDTTASFGVAYYYVLQSYYQNWTSANSNQATAASSNSWLASGSYTGNGLDNRSIAGVGFWPDVIFVKCDCGQDGVVRTSTMAGDASKWISNTGALVADSIQSLDSNGFTVGTDLKVNGSGKVYYWVAMESGTNMYVGSYVGNGAANRNITGVGFQPVWVMTFGDGQDSIFRPGTVSGDVSFSDDGSSQLAGRIQAMQSDGFQVGSHINVNQSGTTYHYIAWKAGAGAVVQTTYVGNAVDNRSITGVGFQPTFVWIKRDTTNVASWRPNTLAGDNSLTWVGASSANEIQALESDGFQVGTNAKVNTNAATYHYLALKNTP